MTDTANQETTNDDSAILKCGIGPCEYFTNNKNSLRQHKYSHHKDFTVTAGSFQAHAVPEFKGKKPMLRCLNCCQLWSSRDTFNSHLFSMKCDWCKFFAENSNGESSVQ
jgi:hypothetical protein